MKSIVCYGDSNTWGYDPSTRNRFPRDVRWPGVLRRTLGDNFWIIEEGLSGRTTVWDDPLEGSFRSGKTYLLPCLWSHQPLDMIIIMLGTNDLKKRFSLAASDIAIGAGVLVDIVRTSTAGIAGRAPEILVICPPPIAPIAGTQFVEMFEGGEEKSRLIAAHYRAKMQEKGVHFLDAGQVIVSSKLDAIHLEPDAHDTLGRAVAERVISILG